MSLQHAPLAKDPLRPGLTDERRCSLHHCCLQVRRRFGSIRRGEGLSPVRRKWLTEKMPSQDKLDRVASAATALQSIPPLKVASVWDLWRLLDKEDRGFGPWADSLHDPVTGKGWFSVASHTSFSICMPSWFKECDKAKPTKPL